MSMYLIRINIGNKDFCGGRHMREGKRPGVWAQEMNKREMITCLCQIAKWENFVLNFVFT